MSYTSRIPAIAARLDNVIDAGIRDVAEGIVQDARGRVPVASGSLRDAIHTEQGEDGLMVLAGDDDVFYGHLVEFGTSNTSARPFLIPAGEGKRTSMRTVIAARLKGIV